MPSTKNEEALLLLFLAGSLYRLACPIVFTDGLWRCATSYSGTVVLLSGGWCCGINDLLMLLLACRTGLCVVL